MASKMRKTETKAPYAAPQLKEFGSVRNLTGGSGGMSGDSGNIMTMMD